MRSLLSIFLLFVSTAAFADSVEMQKKREFDDLASCLASISKETSYGKNPPFSEFSIAGYADSNAGIAGFFQGVGGRHEKINDYVINGDEQKKTFVRFASETKSDLRAPTEEQAKKRNIKMEVCNFEHPARGAFKLTGLAKQKTFKFLNKQSSDLEVTEAGTVKLKAASSRQQATQITCSKVSAAEEQQAFSSLQSKMKSEILNRLRGLDPSSLNEIYKKPSSSFRPINEEFQRGLLARTHTCAKVGDQEVQQEIVQAGNRIMQACRRTDDPRRNCPSDDRLPAVQQLRNSTGSSAPAAQ